MHEARTLGKAFMTALPRNHGAHGIAWLHLGHFQVQHMSTEPMHEACTLCKAFVKVFSNSRKQGDTIGEGAQ